MKKKDAILIVDVPIMVDAKMWDDMEKLGNKYGLEWTTVGLDSGKACFEKGFNILMDYFDCIPEEERADVDKRLKKCGL